MRGPFPILILLLLLLCCAGPVLASGADWGRMYTVRANVPVHESPDVSALQVRVLKSGQKVRVDFVDDGWAAVFDPTEKVRAETRAQGYVRLSELRSGARAEPMLQAELSGKTDKADKAEKPGKGSKAETPAKPAKAKAKAAAQAEGFGEIRVADRKMAVRAGRDKDSEFVRLLPEGKRVRVDFHEDGWFAVFAPGETVRDLSRAWGYGRDKFLVPEKDFTGVVLPDSPPSPAEAKAAHAAALKHDVKADVKPEAKPEAKAGTRQKPGQDGDAVGYAVLGRQADHLRPLAPVVLRVRLEVQGQPAPEALRKIAREIWKAERRKNEDLQLELLLPGMDKDGLAYGVARFHEDGRIREFWWRDVVLRQRR